MMNCTLCSKELCYGKKKRDLDVCTKKAPELHFQKLTMADQKALEPYFSLRPNKICDSSFLDVFLWSRSNRLEYCLIEGEAILWKMELDGEIYTVMPSCREEDLPYYFHLVRNYFNKELNCPVRIFLADEEAVEYLGLRDDPYYQISEQEDLKDYLYDAEKLRTLSGRAYHKKKNLVNKFKKQYEGRWEYRSLSENDAEEIKVFLENWYISQNSEEEGLDKEKEGIWDVLNNPIVPEIRMGAIYVDGRMEAFSMGNYNDLEEMAFICVEKANSQIPGLYQAINQQFAEHEFPQARVINREDDVGLEGLRKAKLSYNPIGYAKKYKIVQSLY
ncbi:phosphatidylglycerol lysyltransferase domain-containing protein [Anaerovorax odorimutans]|uniref:Phosphatidylglycerol lysyltransferase domain-containing protein n=1 Tax=Anaerovorax odorimutans TaxID=109327 RepID=A0ABT1RLG6_9FIRM|nr:phosphatidylglycerol lysyltransferase domain-containing protein [Anaerovorax odorimutans]MCQ4635786.1 phosphatidylglycerol lysyltransferase domain-containing protein [Anaerovorax odorimutans]